MLWEQRNTDRYPDGRSFNVNDEGIGHQRDEAPRQKNSGLWILQKWKDNGEFIPADPGDGINRSDRAAHSLGGFDEHTIADFMPAAVVDLLKAIKIEIEHPQAAAVAACECDRLLQALAEDRSIDQTGQVVMVGKITCSLFGALALRDVGVRAHGTAARPGHAANLNNAAIRPLKLLKILSIKHQPRARKILETPLLSATEIRAPLVVKNVEKRWPAREEFFRQLEQFRRPLVGENDNPVAVNHHQPLVHGRERRLERTRFLGDSALAATKFA